MPLLSTLGAGSARGFGGIIAAGGTPWTFNQAKFVPGTGTNGQYNHSDPQHSTRGVVFNEDGTEMVVLTTKPNGFNYNIYLESYALGTPYVVTSATRTYQLTVATNTGFKFGPLRVNNDGTRFYYGQTSGATLPLQVELSTSWDLSSFVSETNGDSQLQNISSYFLFNGAGTILYMFESTGTNIKVFNLSTAWDIAAVTPGTDITSISGQGFGGVTETGFSHDGSVLYIKDSSLVFTAVDVTTPFDLTTINWSSKTSNANYGTNINTYSSRNSKLPSSYFCVASTATTTRIIGSSVGLTSAISNSGPSAADVVNFDIEVPSNVYNPPTSLTGNQTGNPWYSNLWTNFSVQFNSDGSNLVIGRHYNAGSEYFQFYDESLSTNYDISSSGYTTSYSSMSGGALTNNIRALSFRFTEDGTKSIFMGGPTTNYVFSYSTPFDPSTRTASTFFELNGGSTSDELRFSPFYYATGAMFNDTQDELTFAVSNPGMRSNLSDFSHSLSPGLYTVPLGTPGDITTADTSGIGVLGTSVSGNQINPFDNHSLEFNSTGSNFTTFTDNYGYTFDVGLNYGVGSVSKSFALPYLPSYGSQTQLLTDKVRSSSFNDDGTVAYFLDIDKKCIQFFDLTTPYDITDVGNNLPQSGLPDNMWWRNDGGNSDIDSFTMNPSGTKIYRLRFNFVEEYPLSTAWDLSTSSATKSATLTVASQTFANPGGDIAWGDSGNYFYRIIRSTTAGIFERYAASTPYDLGSCGSTPDKSFTFGSLSVGYITSQNRMFFKPDGTSVFMYAVSFNTNEEFILQWDMSTAWDPTTIASTTTPDASVTLSLVNDDYAAGIHFKSDGSELFVAQQLRWYKFNLGTNWDLSTVDQNSANVETYSTYALPINSSNGINGLYVSPDETKLFIGTTQDLLIKTDFGSALDFKTLSHDGGPYCWYFSDPQNVGGVAKWIGSTNNEFRWKPDGTSIYIYSISTSATTVPVSYIQDGTGSDPVISQFNLSTAWDLTTATYAGGAPLNNSLSGFNVYSFDISSNGEYVILCNEGLYMGTMSTPWDITTLSTVTEQLVGGLGWDDRRFGADEPAAVRWHPNDGSAIYTKQKGLSNRMVIQKMTLTTPYDPTTAVAAVEGTAKFQEILPTNSIWGNWPGTNTYPYYSCFQFQDSGNYMYFLETPVDDTGEDTDYDINIRAFSLSTPYDVTTATEMPNFQISFNDSPPGSNNFTNSQAAGSVGYFDWHPDGKKFIVTSGFLIGEYKV
jgi:hypothetical protein